MKNFLLGICAAGFLFSQPSVANLSIAQVQAYNCNNFMQTGITPGECNALRQLYINGGGPNWNYWYTYDYEGDSALQPMTAGTFWFSSQVGASGWKGITVENASVVGLTLPMKGPAGPQISAISTNLNLLPSLKKVEMFFTGTMNGSNIGPCLPQAPFFANPSIQELHLYAATGSFCSPQAFPNWLSYSGFTSRIKVLKLGGNGWTSTIPSWIGNLSHLEEFAIANTSMSGNLPQSVSSLIQLKKLRLYNNNFGGTLPTGLASSTQLSVLDLHENGFFGSLPTYLNSLTQLRYLNLSHNLFSGEVPSGFWTSHASMVELDLSNNWLIGYAPSATGVSPGLQKLKLNDNYFLGSLAPQYIQGTTNLNTLHLNNNCLNDIGSQLIVTLQNLVVDDLVYYVQRPQSACDQRYSPITGVVGPATLGTSTTVTLSTSLVKSYQDNSKTLNAPRYSSTGSRILPVRSLLTGERILTQ